MKLHLVDTNVNVVDAWKKHFADFSDVDIQHDDILNVAEHCLVSPANSHGFMDGGIDQAYLDFFGPSLERAVRTQY